MSEVFCVSSKGETKEEELGSFPIQEGKIGFSLKHMIQQFHFWVYTKRIKSRDLNGYLLTAMLFTIAQYVQMDE